MFVDQLLKRFPLSSLKALPISLGKGKENYRTKAPIHIFAQCGYTTGIKLQSQVGFSMKLRTIIAKIVHTMEA